MKQGFGIRDSALVGAGVLGLCAIARKIDARGVRAFTNLQSRIPNPASSGANA